MHPEPDVLILSNLSKTYDKQSVFRDFHYHFKQTGCYLLFGPSGCGKTTLLNIIAGLTDFQGSVSLCHHRYHHLVKKETVDAYIAYIAQDNYFVDYLTVQDNLLLTGAKPKQIQKWLDQFHLSETLQQFPDTLSGGQKQRLSIIRALLLDQPIILMDEPTASLDQHNKQLIFDMIQVMKKDHLVIVSSHDRAIFPVVDQIIDFKHLPNRPEEDRPHTTIRLKKSRHQLPPLWKMMRKELTNGKREKRTTWIFTLILLLVFITGMLLIYPEKKIYSNLERKYKTNQLEVICPKGQLAECMAVLENASTAEIVVNYDTNVDQVLIHHVPDGSSISQYEQYQYDQNIYTLPANETLFHLSDLIIAGHYFQDEKDVLISEDYAMEYFPHTSLDDIIGQTIQAKMSDLSYETFTICGIMRWPRGNEAKYFRTTSLDMLFNDSSRAILLLNNQYVSHYLDTELLNQEYTVIFDCYFNNFSDALSCYEKWQNETSFYVRSISSAFFADFQILVSLSMYIYPIMIVCLLLSVIFFSHSEKVRQSYKQYNQCVYLYCHYTWKEVYHGLLISETLHKLKQLAIALIGALSLSLSINILDQLFNLFPFRLFLWDPWLLGGVSLVFLMLSIVIDAINFSNIRHIGWFNMLKERRDLI